MSENTAKSHRKTRLLLAILVASSGLTTLMFDIVYSFILQSSFSLKHLQAVAIVTSTLGAVTYVHLLLLLPWQVRNCQRVHPFFFGQNRYGICILSSLSGLFGILSSFGTTLLFSILITQATGLPKKTLRFPTRNLVIAAFISRITYMISLCIYTIVVIRFQSKRDITQLHGSEGPWKITKEMERVDACQRFSLDSEIFSSQCYSKAFSETLPLFKPLMLSDNISESKYIRPIEEYCPNKTYAQYISSIGLAKLSDNSIRQLETIPGSPSTVISPDLHLNLPKSNDAPRSGNYSRSGSLAKNSCEYISHYPRSRTSTISSNESHIHPLFRTDSLSHPEATPGTVVTAAPGAGCMIIDIACISSLKNAKKHSLPGSGIDVLGKKRWG